MQTTLEIFCRTKTEAELTKIAITQKLQERLKLEVSEEKTKVVNVKKEYSEFLGFKIRLHGKDKKQVVQSHISDKQLKRKKQVPAEIHDSLKTNKSLMINLMRQPLYGRSCEYADNRIALFSAQSGKCAVTGQEFADTSEIHCHHKVPKHMGGTDDYEKLVLLSQDIHKLIHANIMETIGKYKIICDLNKEQMKKINNLRKLAGYAEIA